MSSFAGTSSHLKNALVSRAKTNVKPGTYQLHGHEGPLLCRDLSFALRNEKAYPGQIDSETEHTRCAGAHHDDLFPLVLFGVRVIARVHDPTFEFFL